MHVYMVNKTAVLLIHTVAYSKLEHGLTALDTMILK